MPAVPQPGAANGFQPAWPPFEKRRRVAPRSSIAAPAGTWPRFWYNPEKRRQT